MLTRDAASRDRVEPAMNLLDAHERGAAGGQGDAASDRDRLADPPVDVRECLTIRGAMPLLTIVPPMPGAERRFQPFVDFVRASGWATEFVQFDWTGSQPNFGSTALFPQVDAQTAGKVVMGFSLGALYAHLGALRARHLILGSISPFFLEDDDEPQRWNISYRAGNAAIPADVLVGAKEDEQMHRRATAVRDFYRQHTYTDVAGADHELWHPNYLHAIKAALDRLAAPAAKLVSEETQPAQVLR